MLKFSSPRKVCQRSVRETGQAVPYTNRVASQRSVTHPHRSPGELSKDPASTGRSEDKDSSRGASNGILRAEDD